MTVLTKVKGCDFYTGYPNAGSCGENDMVVGYHPNLEHSQFLLQFEDAELSPSQIVSAELYLNKKDGYNLGVSAKRVTEAWTNPTWVTQPTYTAENEAEYLFTDDGWGVFDIVEIMRDIANANNYGVIINRKAGEPLEYMTAHTGGELSPTIIVNGCDPHLNFGNHGIFLKPIQFLDGIYTT